MKLHDKIEIKSVPDSAAKINFEIKIKGSIDWNRDFVTDNNFEPSDLHMITSYCEDDFKSAITRWLRNGLNNYNHFNERLGDTADIMVTDVSRYVLKAYEDVYNQRHAGYKAKIKQEIKETEEKLKLLKKKL